MSLQLVEFKYSEETLERFLEIVTPVLSEAPEDTVFMFGPRTESNKIEIILLTEDLGLVSMLEGLVPADALAIEVSPDSMAETADSRTTYPPYKAGRQVIDIDAPGLFECTAAFDMVFNTGEVVGLHQGSSAGHCGRNGDRINSGAAGEIPVGVGNSNTFFVSDEQAFGDSMLIGYGNQEDATSLVYINESTSVGVRGKLSIEQLGLGLPLSKSGRTTEITNGHITRTYPQTIRIHYFDPETGDLRQKLLTNLVCSDVLIDAGDSGAPMFQQVGSGKVKAAGIASARLIVDGEFAASCFDPITHVESVTDTHVWGGGAQNTFESGTDEADITPANSRSPDPFDATTWGGTTTKFDTATAAHGQLSGRFSGYVSPPYVEYSRTIGTTTEIYGRVYVRLTTLPSAEITIVQRLKDLLPSGSIGISSAGFVQVHDSSSVRSGTVAVSTTAWNRIEFHFISSYAGTAILEARLFKGDSTLERDVIGPWIGATTPNLNMVRLGLPQATTEETIWLDDVLIDSATWPGPAS